MLVNIDIHAMEEAAHRSDIDAINKYWKSIFVVSLYHFSIAKSILNFMNFSLILFLTSIQMFWIYSSEVMITLPFLKWFSLSGELTEYRLWLISFFFAMSVDAQGMFDISSISGKSWVRGRLSILTYSFVTDVHSLVIVVMTNKEHELAILCIVHWKWQWEIDQNAFYTLMQSAHEKCL